MSWRDYLTDKERQKLERAEVAKKATADVYNSIIKELKDRCDARIRREKQSQK
ncbi:hypothetical protein GCM10007094_41290 [Pseudovibrio japonicus]|uniref:Uncharacterized protein n=1 Tax=Pseudovibrio japonicus TaxID=366534 RepID=A0ABQ3EVW0_9HYPH|nr:hypothetical protein GCM10007094_41290 [Pseudovibrio japonicus]